MALTVSSMNRGNNISGFENFRPRMHYLLTLSRDGDPNSAEYRAGISGSTNLSILREARLVLARSSVRLWAIIDLLLPIDLYLRILSGCMMSLNSSLRDQSTKKYRKVEAEAITMSSRENKVSYLAVINKLVD
jgi:hypothetical protein